MEEWKGENHICFCLCFLIRSQIEWNFCFDCCLSNVFILPVAHLFWSARGTYRWLKLLIIWDSISDCRVDIQRGVGLGRKNEKRCHQGTASIHRLVDFMCLTSSDRLKRTFFALKCKFQCLMEHFLLLSSSDTSSRNTRGARPCLCSGNEIILPGNQMKLNLSIVHVCLPPHSSG